ncbi:MAG: M48 family metallopeptidase [Elusimicrobiaceae bacterium]|nr:M48 family metallopeptidase [Elusimicrobiaceae bacterium]
MAEIKTTISDIKLFIENLHSDMPEVFEKKNSNSKTPSTRNKVLYMGDVYDVKISANPEKNTSCEFIDDIFHINLKDNTQNPSKIVETWLREKANEILKQKIDVFAQKMELEYNRLVIKDQKTVWGSCSEKSNINLSYRLIKMPENVIDYLVLHELAHLVHLNHSSDYWDIVEKYCPDHKRFRKWLNNNKVSLFDNAKLKYVKEKDPYLNPPKEEVAKEVKPAQEQAPTSIADSLPEEITETIPEMDNILDDDDTVKDIEGIVEI